MLCTGHSLEIHRDKTVFVASFLFRMFFSAHHFAVFLGVFSPAPPNPPPKPHLLA